jgi:hypothetical protein
LSAAAAKAHPGDQEIALCWDREDFRPGAGFVAVAVLAMEVGVQ